MDSLLGVTGISRNSRSIGSLTIVFNDSFCQDFFTFFLNSVFSHSASEFDADQEYDMFVRV